ncbi:MAG TPA: biotin synthase BioB [Thermodesulfobacteriota bacterium]|nr:biotin synthase BioB [Thermodesulfobacteriota bacterium]
MNANIIESVRDKVIGRGDEVTFDDAVELADTDFSSLPALMSLSNAVTSMYHEKGVYLCSITSGRTGACPEDCRFCAQSIYSDDPVQPRTVIAPREILESAKRAEAGGASEFCIVISGRGPNEHVFDRVLESVRLIRTHTDMSIGCSLGILTEEQAGRLSAAGVRRYNHNLETSRSFFPRICTTHAYEDRLGTARLVKKSGIGLCCGGIIGLGETAVDRIGLAYELKGLDPEVVPLNFLNPRPGTGLGEMKTLHPFEALKVISIFRIILPKSILLCAGGREAVLGEYQPWALFAGANALIGGDYLTTKGDPMEKDTGMIRGLGLPVLRYS